MYFSLSGSVVRLMNTWLSFFLVSGKHVQEKVKVGLRVFYERGRCITQTSWTCWFVSFFSFLLFSFSFFIFYSHLPPCSFWLFSFRVSFFRFLVFPLFLFLLFSSFSFLCFSSCGFHFPLFFIFLLLLHLPPLVMSPLPPYLFSSFIFPSFHFLIYSSFYFSSFVSLSCFPPFKSIPLFIYSSIFLQSLLFLLAPLLPPIQHRPFNGHPFLCYFPNSL